MSENRPYQHDIYKPDDNVNLSSLFVTLDSKNWKRPRTLSLENLGGVLNIKFEEDLSERNVTSVEFINQDEFPTLPPNTFKVNTRTHIAVDENYLYVWVTSLNKWKRIILSSWQ